jgi:nucleoside-diphosphate-sugar epimerase
MAGPDRPFLLASGVAALTQGKPAREDDASPFHGPESPRGGSENLALEFVNRGVHTVSLRFAPTVHGAGDHGFIAVIAAVAPEKDVSGYPGDGTNRWAAVHRSDAARLVALGLAKAPAGVPPARGRGRRRTHPRHRGGYRPRLRAPRHIDRP